ncbi:MAG: hypothetical protein LBD67_09335 [Candidatus Accumulibacter sp.]|nr:hypothetical protein [Accumulibacter sp.]
MDTFPSFLRAGDSFSWRGRLKDAPAGSGWALAFRILWPSGMAPYDFGAGVDGEDYTVVLSGAETAPFIPGRVTLVLFFTRDGERITLPPRRFEILPDLLSAGGLDPRSFAERALADLENALALMMAGGQGHVEQYSIAGRSMKFRSVADIIALIRYYEAQVAAGNALTAAIAGGSARVQVRF